MALPQAREVEVGIAISHGGDCGEWYVCAVSIPTDTLVAAADLTNGTIWLDGPRTWAVLVPTSAPDILKRRP